MVAASTTSAITGTVTDSGGDPVEGVGVWAYDADADWGTSTTTADDGTYSLLVVPGTYTIRFQVDTGTYLEGYYSTSGFTLEFRVRHGGRRLRRRGVRH